MKVKNWWVFFEQLLAQESLVNKHLYMYAEEMREFSVKGKQFSLIERAALLWKCIYSTMQTYEREHSNWIYIKHETLSADPLTEFRKLYGHLDLNFSKQAENKIALASGAHNPSEQNQDNEFIRDSVKNIQNWKKRLTQDEIDLVWDRTNDVANHYYDESEW